MLLKSYSEFFFFFFPLNYFNILRHSRQSFGLQGLIRIKGKDIDLLKDLWDEEAGDSVKKIK